MKKYWTKVKQPLFFAAYLAVLGMLVTVIAYVGYNLKQPIVDANRQQKIKDNVALLYAEEDGYVTNLDLPVNSYQELSYDLIDAVYEVSKDGELYAIIYDMQTLGRNGIINALVAVNPYTDTIDAVVYYNHTETPNLGEVYTRDVRIAEVVGDNVENVEFDAMSGATTTWNALVLLYNEIATHYDQEEVHIDG
jgi:Na+-transporting NADH:ubiquinone oxidoreductase subunit C